MTQQKKQSETHYEEMSPELDGSLPPGLVAAIFSENHPSVLVASLYLGEKLYQEIAALGDAYRDDISSEIFVELLNKTSAMLAREDDEAVIIPAMVKDWKGKNYVEKH